MSSVWTNPWARLSLAAALLIAADASAQQPAVDAPAGGPAPQLTPSTAERIPPDPKKLAEWARQLDADEFLTRDTATLRLIEAGSASLDVLSEGLPRASVEATARSLYILRQIGLSADIETQERAWDALTAAAEVKEHPALARRAAAVLDQLREQRADRALSDLLELGAEIKYQPELGGLAFNPSPSLVVGDRFRGSVDDLRRLKWISDISIVQLVGAKVTDAWLAHVAAMPNLAELHLYQANVTDEGLRPTAASIRLDQIGIYYTKVGDKALEPLGKLPALRLVKLYGTAATAEGAKALEQATAARVDHRRGAFLGVGGSGLDQACLIGTVHAGSPAEKAGLAQNDVIVRFGEGKVTTFDSLTALISLREAGEEVEVEVLRQTLDDDGNTVLRPVTTKVKLAPWGLDVAVWNGPR